MSELRQYEGFECGEDGYPFAWHGKCGCDFLGVDADDCAFGDCFANAPAIKDVIREEAKNRCERCWHPYSKGEGEWSRCDEMCGHMGPLRWVYHDGVKSGEITDPLTIVSTLGIPGQHRAETFKRAEFYPEARWRVLTVHHLDEDKANCRWWNLVALCQRCHLNMQRRVVMDRPFHYEHSEWFKPYAAAFYAFKYLGEDLSREQVMARQDELLKLEHRFDQGVLL